MLRTASVSWRLFRNETFVRSKSVAADAPILGRYLAWQRSCARRQYADVTDTEIWQYAKTHDFLIVSKDSDFQARSLLYRSPPKFIWLRVGNCPVKQIEELLRKVKYKYTVYAYDASDNYSYPIEIYASLADQFSGLDCRFVTASPVPGEK